MIAFFGSQIRNKNNYAHYWRHASCAKLQSFLTNKDIIIENCYRFLEFHRKFENSVASDLIFNSPDIRKTLPL